MNAKLWLRALVGALALSSAPLAASAQIFTPSFMAPRAERSVGIYLSDLADLAVEGIVRSNFGGFDLGFRAGVVDAGDAALTVGAELRNPLVVGTAPIDLAFTAGVQGLLGDLDRVGLQAGLSLGHTFASPGLNITPYLHPRVALVDRPVDDELEAELLADLGFNLDFGNGLSLRFNAGIEHAGGEWGVGLAWR